MTLDTFFEKFDLFADAPNAVAKLRELVLNLAVQGRLVSQSPNDSSAEFLAAQIAHDRAAFVKKRALARQRAFAPVKDDQCPFALPRGWEWTRLGNLCRVQAGFAFQSAAFVQGDSGVPMIRIRDITKDCTQVNYVGEYREEFLVEPGDYLVGMDGNFTVAKWRGPCALLNQRVSRLQWYSRSIEPSFFAVALQHRLSELQGTKAYTTVDHLSSGQIEDAVVPLPSLAEQKRIVAKVDELMALCDQLEAQQQERKTRLGDLARASLARFAEAPTPANLEFLFHHSYAIPPADLRRCIYQAAFDGVLTSKSRQTTPPLALPPGWAQRDVASLCVIEDGDRGGAYPKKEDFSESGHCVFLNTKNVRRHGFDFTTLEWISEEKHQQLRKGMLVRGDVVFTSRGTIGNIAHFDDAVPFDVMRINSGMFILRGFQKHMEAPFLSRLLRSPQIRNQIDSLQSGSAQPQLPIREFRKFTAKIPPLAEQRRIVAKVDKLMALVDALETQLATARTTAAALLTAAVAEFTFCKQKECDET